VLLEMIIVSGDDDVDDFLFYHMSAYQAHYSYVLSFCLSVTRWCCVGKTGQ